jgi:4-hydroxy-3-methylbut-2-en-1-yl diphosphate reductase
MLMEVFMEVISIVPRSYCKGVVSAINMAKAIRQKHPTESITILGPLVHNRFVIEALSLLNIKTMIYSQKDKLELLNQIQDGVIMFTAHGVSDQVKNRAKSKGLICYDATCEDVFATQALIKQALQANKKVLYVGKKDHPESMAVIENDASVVLITTIADIPQTIEGPVFVTNQTTLSLLDVKPIFDAIIACYPHVEIAQEVCDATIKRQQAVMKTPDVDGIIVVGDPLSNNTRMLAKIAKETHQGWVMMIESVEDLDLALLKQSKTIAITAGASTPPAIVNQIIDYCKQFDPINPQPLPTVDIQSLLI